MKTTTKLMKSLSAGALMFMGILSMGNVATAEKMKLDDFKDTAVRKAVEETYFSGSNDDDENYDGYEDGYIETDNIKDLQIGFELGTVKDLSGIEKLTKLEEIEIWKFAGNTVSLQQITLKKVSIHDSEAKIVSVDAPCITYFYFGSVGTEKLNMNTPMVTDLMLSGNKLTSLEGLTKSIRSRLTNFYLINTGLYASVDVSDMVNLNTLDLSGEKIKSIRGLNNLKKIELVTINYTKLRKLDFSKNKKLVYLDCDHNRLTSLKLPPNLWSLCCYGNQLTKIDVSKCRNLKYLYVGQNKLRNVDIRKNKKLIRLSLIGNKNLKSIDITKNKKLEYLHCSNTNISSLNLKNNKNLSCISYYGSKIKKLDLSRYKNLTILYVAKKGQTVQLKKFLGTGYKCLSKPDYITYNKSKNAVKVNFRYEVETVELKKGKKVYRIIMCKYSAPDWERGYKFWMY